MSTEPHPPRRRDAARTRQALLDAARRRFARDGYAATTVRDIADDAGVNVALISRYFASKEGLFEECLSSAGETLHRGEAVPFDRVAAVIAEQVAGLADGDVPSQLALLLRSSGDERADELRLGVLRTSTERLAAAAGWGPAAPGPAGSAASGGAGSAAPGGASADGPPGDDRRLLRAQVVLAAAIGMALLRSTSKLEPLASATEAELTGPLRDMITALLAEGPQ